MSTFNGWEIITLPAFPGAPRSVEWDLDDVVGEAVSPFSRQAQIQDWGQAELRASVSYQPMTNAQARPWLAFLAAARGVGSVFLMGDPLHTGPQNGGASGGSVTGSGQTGFVLVTSSSGLTAGDWFALGLRLYMVTSVSGGTLGIWPPIRESPAGGTTLTIANPKGLFRLATNKRRVSVDVAKTYGVSFEVKEAL